MIRNEDTSIDNPIQFPFTKIRTSKKTERISENEILTIAKRCLARKKDKLMLLPSI